MTKLTSKIIESFNLETTPYRPDHDDFGYKVTLPNGIELTGFHIINNEPVDNDALEGLDGYIYIESKEELETLISKTWDDVCKEIEKDDEDFDRTEFE